MRLRQSLQAELAPTKSPEEIAEDIRARKSKIEDKATREARQWLLERGVIRHGMTPEEKHAARLAYIHSLGLGHFVKGMK
jgi:hypothetical protein